jgi:hypothetical protein
MIFVSRTFSPSSEAQTLPATLRVAMRAGPVPLQFYHHFGSRGAAGEQMNADEDRFLERKQNPNLRKSFFICG